MDIDERILSHKFTRCDPPTRRQLLDVRRMLRENRCVLSKHEWLVMWIDHATRGWYKAFKQGKKGEYLVAFAYPRLKINTTDNVKAVDMRLGGGLVEVKTDYRERTTHFVAKVNRDTGEPDGPWRAVAGGARYFIKVQAYPGASGTKPHRMFLYDAVAFRDRCEDVLAQSLPVCRVRRWESGEKYRMVTNYFHDIELNNKILC